MYRKKKFEFVCVHIMTATAKLMCYLRQTSDRSTNAISFLSNIACTLRSAKEVSLIPLTLLFIVGSFTYIRRIIYGEMFYMKNNNHNNRQFKGY